MKIASFLALFAAAIFAVLNWQGILLGVAASNSEQPPEILTDFEWPDRPVSERFSKKFHAGTDEAELIAWLEAEGFATSLAESSASRTYSGVPCAYGFDVSWNAEDGILGANAEARLTSFGCL